MPLKFLGPAGGYTSDAVECLNDATWFANNSNDGVDVKISNNSRGGGGFSQYLKDAIESSGILFVAAASNEGTDNDTSPVYSSLRHQLQNHPYQRRSAERHSRRRYGQERRAGQLLELRLHFGRSSSARGEHNEHVDEEYLRPLLWYLNGYAARREDGGSDPEQQPCYDCNPDEGPSSPVRGQEAQSRGQDGFGRPFERCQGPGSQDAINIDPLNLEPCLLPRLSAVYGRLPN